MTKINKEDTNILRCNTDSTEDASDSSTAGLSISPLFIDDRVVGIEAHDSPRLRPDLDNDSEEFIDSNAAREVNYMIAPCTKEAKENERYARKVGINFSLTRGDYLTLYSGLQDDESITLNDISVALSATTSPQYGKKDDHFTFREMYGNVHQILEKNEVEDESNIQPENQLITPRTRTAMVNHDQIVETLRQRAAILSKDWVTDDNLAPSLARKLRDFEFAQKKRRKMYGKSRKWGILGLYDFLSAVRQDVQWAEDAAFRRSNCLPYLRWCDFIACKRRGVHRSFFAYGILVICTITLIISIAMNGWAFESFSTNPSIGPSADVLIRMGAKESSLIVNSYQIWRLFSPMILHGGIVHFLLNCFAIFYIGRAVEHNHGFLSTAVLFIVPGVGSTIISAMFLPQYVSVGASGGIFGLVGACVADIVKNHKLLFSDFINKGRSKKHHVIVIFVLILDIFLNLLLGLTPYTDNFMHLGGFVLGFICASSMLANVDIAEVQRNRFKSRAISKFYRFFGLIISFVCILVVTIALFHGDGLSSPCKSCGVISCVSFPPWADYDKKWYYCDQCGSVIAYGRKDPHSGKYVAIEMNCPAGNTIIFSLDGYAADKDSLQEHLPSFCRERCLI